ncbi:MAG: BMP family ABC transporter substrate-binding protein [Chloroflexota bacterium]
MRIKLICLLAIVVLGIPACTQSPDCFRKDVFCAALVTDTRGLNDYGINQDTWAGLEQSKANGDVDQIANIASVDKRDYEKNIAFFVNAGYDVVITSGIAMQDATLRSADLKPASVFIGMNQADEESVPNFISVSFPEDQMGFFAGALAARLTRTNIIGAVCENSGIDAMWRYCEGFRAGAKYINDTLDIIVVYRDDGSSEKLFIDEAWGTENAQILIKRGADVIFAVGGETGASALRTATEAKIKSIGAERDQAAALADKGSSVVTSVLGRGSFTVQELMRRVKAGDLADAGKSPIGYVSLDGVVPQGLIAKMDEILTGLATGEIKTNVTYTKR